MNPVLASIYGTHEKVASHGDFDLNDISAADLLQLLEEDEMSKAASGGFDLDSISAADLLELLEEDEDPIEKMASDGSLEYFDTAGRIMAHAYANEMNKVASGGIDLDSISGADLLELLEAGYDIPGLGAEKTAAFMGPLRRTKKGKLTADQKREVRAFLKAKSQMDDPVPTRGAAAAAAARLKDHTPSRKRTASGLGLELGMKSRHYGNVLMNNKGKAGLAALLATGGLGGAGYALKNRNRN